MDGETDNLMNGCVGRWMERWVSEQMDGSFQYLKYSNTKYTYFSTLGYKLSRFVSSIK